MGRRYVLTSRQARAAPDTPQNPRLIVAPDADLPLARLGLSVCRLNRCVFALSPRCDPGRKIRPGSEDRKNVHGRTVTRGDRLRALAGHGAGSGQRLLLFHPYSHASPSRQAAAFDLHSNRRGARHRRVCLRVSALVAYSADADRHRTSMARFDSEKAAAENQLGRHGNEMAEVVAD